MNQDVQESIEKVYLMREQANLVSAQEKETYQKVQESLKRMDVMASEIFKLNQEVRESVSRESLNYSSRALADSNIELNRAKMGELKAMVGKLGQETENLRLESSELKANSELYEQSGETMKYIEKIGRLISLPGLLIYGRGRKGGR